MFAAASHGSADPEISDPDLALQRCEVWKPVPVLLKQRTKRWTRFYYLDPSGRSSKTSCDSFNGFSGR